MTYNPNALITDDPDLYERFVNDYFSLNPKGNVLNAWATIKMHSSYSYADASGNHITIDSLIDSYKQYLLYWKRSYSEKDERFISKEDRLMDPEVFIANRGYQSLWTPKESSKDDYLFGNKSKEYYEEKTTEFKNRIPRI